MLWRLSALFTTLSLLVIVWLSYELGLLSYTKAAAGEGEPVDTLQRSLQEKSKTLSDKENDLAKRERIVADKERILNEQVQRYEKVIRDLRSRITENIVTKDPKVESFRQVYEKMEAKKAARILDDLDPDLVSLILSGMRQERAADILGRMAPDRAKAITEKYLAERKAVATASTKQVNDAKPDK